MTANGKKVMLVVGLIGIALFSVNLGWWYTGGRGFGLGLVSELVVLLGSLWPVAIVGSIIWFGQRIAASLERIEAALSAAPTQQTELTYGP